MEMLLLARLAAVFLMLLRFDEGELETRAEDLRAEGLVLVAAAAAVQTPGCRLRTNMPPQQLRIGPVLPLADAGAGRPAAKDPRAAAADFIDQEPWVAVEQRGGLDVGDPLPASAVVEVVDGDRGVARLRSGTLLAVGRVGSVSPPTPRIEAASVDDAQIRDTIKELSETT